MTLTKQLHPQPVRALGSLLALLIIGSATGSPVAAEETATEGPDVTVYDLYGADHYGSEGSIHAYAVGTESCNQGTEPLNWCDPNNNGCAPGAEDTDHPVIGQNLYRLKDGRFEQLGMSWLKHGFFSVNGSGAGCGDGSCDFPPEGGDQLGVGCTDPYGAGLNGSRPLGRRSTTNPSTGEHPIRPSSGGSGFIAERMQVEAADIDPSLNPGALYWVEGHYVAPDDASRGNGLNNASYRPATFDGNLNMTLTGSTTREKAAIYAWQEADPDVEILVVDIPLSSPAERFHAARRITAGPGTWHYEYVIHNLNSDRAARLFRIEFGPNVNISNVGFRDVDHHSGEPYDTTDWDVTLGGQPGTVEWSTDTFAINADANALRWGTTFSFWFDADAPSVGAIHTLELFKPGLPSEVDLGFDPPASIFGDGFESGDTSAWSNTVLP